MEILRQNTVPKFEIVPRKKLDSTQIFKIILKSEVSKNSQEITSTVSILQNENYNITLNSFPIGVLREKFSYTILQGAEVVSLGKIMIVSQNENVQDFTTITNNKYYS
jgi:hypothetical protein